MLSQARESDYRGDAGTLSDDPVLTIAYTISDLAITVLGPTFWILIVYLFLAEELGFGPA